MTKCAIPPHNTGSKKTEADRVPWHVITNIIKIHGIMAAIRFIWVVVASDKPLCT